MVAATRQTPVNLPAPLLPRSLLAGRGELVRFSVQDVLSMLKQGLLPEDSTVELLHGLIVLKDRSDFDGDPRVHGPKHRMCIRLLTALIGRIDTPNRHAQVQLPIVCNDSEMPEPDFAIIRGVDRDYAENLPTASDAWCVLEVADSSWERDQQEKLEIYAAASIPQYLILNLRNITIEHYCDPDPKTSSYKQKFIIARAGSIFLRGGPDGDVEVKLAEIALNLAVGWDLSRREALIAMPRAENRAAAPPME